ncbi:MAG TPA: CPBP family intramembrane metalloprotease [Bacilli bacterium]|nr:CPBP family intramembrane metalloprotease [Bacilli bacterium]
MKNKGIIIAGLLLANFLLALSFYFLAHVFWVVFPISLTILLLFSLRYGSSTFQSFKLKTWLVALLSGIALYFLFAFGKWLIVLLSLPFLEQLENLYALVQPTNWWHFLCLFLLIIPAEEFFWRGFILESLTTKFSPVVSVLIASLLYGLAHSFSGSILLVLAGLVAGTIWGYMYLKYKNLNAAIISHLVFDLLLLIVFPLI